MEGIFINLKIKEMYLKEIIQYISLPIMIYVVYFLSFKLYKKLENKNLLK